MSQKPTLKEFFFSAYEKLKAAQESVLKVNPKLHIKDYIECFDMDYLEGLYTHHFSVESDNEYMVSAVYAVDDDCEPAVAWIGTNGYCVMVYFESNSIEHLELHAWLSIGEDFESTIDGKCKVIDDAAVKLEYCLSHIGFDTSINELDRFILLVNTKAYAELAAQIRLGGLLGEV